MAQGLIAAALGGFGKALATVGEMEAKKQNEAKLRKELMAAESEERLRIDEITRKRDIEGIGQKTEATARANLAAAPIVGQTSAVTESAALDAAETTKLADKRAKAKAGGEAAELDAAETAKLADKRAAAKVGGEAADLDARKRLKMAEKEADAAMEKRLAELNAEKNKNLTKLEAERTARIEREKYEAMLAAGVSEAKAKALMADYIAGDAQRKKQASDAIQAEIDATIKKGGNKDYLKAESKISVAKSAGDIAEINAREAARDSTDKKEKARNTIEMERQIKETEKEMGRLLGIGDPKKIPDEINYLESQAKKGNKDAIDKLAKLKPLNDELNNLSRDLRSFKRGGSDADKSSPSSATYNYVPGKGLQPNK